MSTTLFPVRAGAWLVSGVGVIAMILAAVGLYGVIAYSVARRTREIGVRMALGARRSLVVGLVMQQGLLLAVAGVALGCVHGGDRRRPHRWCALRCPPSDPVSWFVAIVIVLAVAASANLIPAWSAARVDPSIALGQSSAECSAAAVLGAAVLGAAVLGAAVLGALHPAPGAGTRAWHLAPKHQHPPHPDTRATSTEPFGAHVRLVSYVERPSFRGSACLWKDKAFSLTAVLTLARVHRRQYRALFSGRSRAAASFCRFTSRAHPADGQSVSGRRRRARRPVGRADYYDRLRETTVFSEQAMYSSSDVSVDQNGTPTRVRVMNVTPSFFRLLGIAPQCGRIFQDSEGEIGSENKVLLSHALWQSAFGGDPQVIGRDIRVDGQPCAVVGILPRSFSFLRDDVMLWRPLAFTPQRKEQRHSNNWYNIGRLKPGATMQQAQEQIDALNRANLDRFPQYKQLLINAALSHDRRRRCSKTWCAASSRRCICCGRARCSCC